MQSKELFYCRMIADAILESKVKLICLVFEEFEKQFAQVEILLEKLYNK